MTVRQTAIRLGGMSAIVAGCVTAMVARTLIDPLVQTASALSACLVVASLILMLGGIPFALGTGPGRSGARPRGTTIIRHDTD